jgi:hypothetical protein
VNKATKSYDFNFVEVLKISDVVAEVYRKIIEVTTVLLSQAEAYRGFRGLSVITDESARRSLIVLLLLQIRVCHLKTLKSTC